jgi:hypothetical protein
MSVAAKPAPAAEAGEYREHPPVISGRGRQPELGDYVPGVGVHDLGRQVPPARDGMAGASLGHQAGHRKLAVAVLAQEEARMLRHSYIGTEHLLLGLIREGDGMAAQVLVSLGGDLNRVRQQVILQLHGEAGPSAAGARPRLGRRERERLIDDALAGIGRVDQRLAAVERWVGLAPDLDDLDQEIAHVRREIESAIGSQDFESAAALPNKGRELIDRRISREQEWTATAADRPAPAGGLGRLKAELKRLRAVLRQHGIEAGDDAA